MTKKNILFIVLLFFLAIPSITFSQEEDIDFSTITKEEVLNMGYEQLLDLPFEDLIKLADVVGVSAEELLEMVLNKELSTASKKSETLFDSPLSASVITSEEIKNSGANSLQELFRLVQGMLVREKTNGNYDVHMRGMDNIPPGNFSHFATNTLSLVMIDNRIVYNYINGGTFWETLPVSLNDIERIDIVKGPSSALYGPNAVSGVINIITQKPESGEFKLDVDGRYGTLNTKLADFKTSIGVSNKLKLKLTGNYEYRDRFMDDYYSFRKAQYVPSEDVKSLFGYSYTGGDRNTLPTPDMAKDRYSSTFSAYYDESPDLNFRLTGGTQQSEVQTIFFENLATPFSNRFSNTQFIDFVANVKGLTAQASHMGGKQDLSVGMLKPVIHYDMNYTNMNVEYNWQLMEGLGIRPGVNFQQATYNDNPYVQKAQESDPGREGLLNGKQSLNNYGASLRFDYNVTDDLRLVLALRGDQYDKPDDLYLSYQMAGSYKIANRHLIRSVYSRANRGAFIGNVYADFQNPLGSQPGGQTMIEFPAGSGNYRQAPVIIDNYYQYYLGNESIELLTMDMIELGHRWKIQENLQTDVELFYTRTSNFDALQQVGAGQQLNELDMSDPANPIVHIDYHDSLRYENLDVVATQLGGSFSLNYKPASNLLVKFFGTYQGSKLYDYMPDDASPDSLINKKHTWTPVFYGGITLNYSPFEKFNIYTSAYYFAEQTYHRYESPYAGTLNPNETGKDAIDQKVIVNLKLSYRFWNESTVYFNARNLLNGTSREFGFADDTKGLYMLGVRLML
jgi:iron complex outermembrane recepter protein